jgi:hypothetical protein
MKQKFTSEKNKYLENKNLKNESMFNFKISCLMKKQFISLMMVLAMVILAGTSAMAQNDGDIPTQPAVHLPGSTHPVSITAGTGTASNVSWTLYAGTDATTVADGTHTTTSFPVTGESFNLVWTDLAAGAYYLEATETDNDPTCAVTKRGFHLCVLGFDATVYASDDAGAPLKGDALSSCSRANEYAVFMNDLGVFIDGSERTTGTDSDDNGSLTNYIGTNPRTTRHFSVSISFDDVPTGYNFTAPDLGSIVADIVTTSSSDLYSVNGTTATDENSFTLDDEVIVENSTAASENIFTFPAIYNDRWGTDITTSVLGTDIRIYTSADGTGTSLGEEPSSHEDTVPDTAYDDNRSEEFTIQAAPNTSTITVN